MAALYQLTARIATGKADFLQFEKRLQNPDVPVQEVRLCSIFFGYSPQRVFILIRDPFDSGKGAINF